MTTRFVSNAATNGYTVGNDTTGNGTQLLPYLTINKALSVSSAGDVVTVNPSGTTYSENSGSNYLDMTVAATVQTDPTLLAAQGRFVLTSPSGGSRLINLAAGAMFQYVTFDNAAQSRDFVHAQGGSYTANFIGCLWQNSTGAAIGINCANAALYNIVTDKCTMSSSNNNSSSAIFITGGGALSAGSTITNTGATISGIGSAVSNVGNGTNATITFGASTDGTRSYINCANGIRLSVNSTYAVSATATDFTCSGVGISDNGVAACNTTSLNVQNCSFNGGNGSTGAIDITFATQIGSGTLAYNQFLGAHQNLVFNNVLITNLLVHDNTVNVSGMAANKDNFNFGTIGAGIQHYKNTFITDGQSHVVCFGGDGYPAGQSNITGTTTQNLGDTAQDTWIGQPFTFTAGQNGLTYIGSIQPTAKKIGSPTGTITVSLYSTVTGSPGAAQFVSNYTMQAAKLTSSFIKIEYWSDARFKMVSGTTYFIVVNYTGTVDGTNYVQLSANTTGAGLQTSPDGVTWTTGSTSNILFNIFLMNLDATQPKSYQNNYLTTSTTSIIHNQIFNTTDGGLAYQNFHQGGAICTVFKLCDGSVHTLLMSNNMCNTYNQTGGNTGEPALFDKGCKNAQILQNTSIVSASGSNNSCLSMSGDFTVGGTVYNGTPSRNGTALNNILYAGGSSSSYAVILGSVANDLTVINPTIDYNLYFTANSAIFGKYNLGTTGTLTNATTLAAWRTATGQDAHSVYADPKLTVEPSPTTATRFIPLAASPAIGTGTSATLSAVPTDYFGTANTTPPTIGASNPLRRTFASRSLVNNRTLIN